MAAVPSLLPGAAERTLRPTATYIPHAEFSAIEEAIDGNEAPVVNIYGLGGIGKSALIAMYCDQTERPYYYYDLHNAPPYLELATWILGNVFKDSEGASVTSEFSITERLRAYIADPATDVVLIFDNLESIMGVDEESGRITSEHSGYDRFFQSFVTYTGGSTLVLSGREKVKLGFNRNDELRAVKLSGLDGTQAETLLSEFQLSGSFEDLAARYLGNPLALKMAASTIFEDYFGDIGAFLQAPELPHDVYALFREHFDRLSPLERMVLLWLAVLRVPSSREVIASRVWSPSFTTKDLSAAFRNLGLRSLIERGPNGADEMCYFLQGVILEFASDYIVDQVQHEIESCEAHVLHDISLIDTSSPEYIIDAQKRLIVDRIGAPFLASRGLHGYLTLLTTLLASIGERRSYAAGNIVNLHTRCEPVLRSLDLAGATVVNADLRNVHLLGSDLDGAHIERALLRNTYGTLIEVRYSHDDAFLLGAATEFSLVVWEAESLQFVADVSLHRDWVRSVDSNEHYIVTGSNDESVIAYQYADRSMVANDEARHGSRVRRVRLSPRFPDVVYSSGDSGKIIGWRIDTDQFCELDPASYDVGGARCIWDFCFIGDGREIVSVSDSGDVRRWDVSAFEDRSTFEHLHTAASEIKCIVYDGGARVYCGCDDGAILEISLSDSSVIRHQHLSSAIWSIDYCIPRQQLLVGHDDGHVAVWSADETTGHLSLVQVMLEHSSRVWSVDFNGSGTRFVTSSDDFEFKVWDASAFLPLFTVRGYTGLLRTLAVSDESRAVIVGGDDHVIRRYALDTGRFVRNYVGHSNHVRHLDWSPSRDAFLSASDDGRVMLWSDRTSPASVLTGHAKRVWSVTYLDDYHYASVGEENEVYIWEAASEALVQRLSGHTGWIWDISRSPAAGVFATASEDGSCILWAFSTADDRYEQLLPPVRSHEQWLFAVAFSPSGEYFVTCSADCRAIVHLTSTGEVLHSLPHDGWVWSAVFLDDGTLATGSADSKIRVWLLDHARREHLLVKRLEEHTSWVVALDYARSEQVLFSASADWSAKRWSVPEFDYMGELDIERPFSGTSVRRVTGLTQAELRSLLRLGAINE